MSSENTTAAVQITAAELVRKLNSAGSQFVSLRWGGEAKSRFVRDNGRIRKVSHYSGQVYSTVYVNSKARELGIPPEEVQLAPRPWYDADGCVRIHNGYNRDRKTGEITYDSPKKGDMVVVFIPASGNSEYWLDGQSAEYEQVRDLLPKVRPPKVAGKPTARERYREISMAKITSATIGGVEYTLV